VAEPNIRLRPIRIQDASVLFKWRNDPEVIKWSRNNVPLTDYSAHLALMARRAVDQTGEIHRLVVHDDTPVGTVWTVFDPEEAGAVPEVHYRVAPEWRNKGIATTAVRCFLEQTVLELRHGRFKVPIIAGNKASERVAEKLGLHPGARTALSEDREIVEWIR
jgi:RimJ/RimL family protein N-acetyltransferase